MVRQCMHVVTRRNYSWSLGGISRVGFLGILMDSHGYPSVYQQVYLRNCEGIHSLDPLQAINIYRYEHPFLLSSLSLSAGHLCHLCEAATLAQDF